MKKMEYVKNIKKPRRFNMAANLGYWCFAFFVIAAFCAAAGIGGLPPSAAAALLSAWFVFSVLLTGIRKADEWERAIVLRFGKFKAVSG